jgi:hypothetical protein
VTEDKEKEDLKRKRPEARTSSERPEKIAKTARDDTPATAPTKDRERDVPKVSSSVKVSLPSTVAVKKDSENSGTKRRREEGALEDGN